jgi:hypothetical protein
MIIKRHFGPAALVFLLAGCAGQGAARQEPPPSGGVAEAETVPLLRDHRFPPGLEFRPGTFSPPAVAPGVGEITREREDPLTRLGEDAKRAVTESFREAWRGGLLRGLPLEGTLGGDLVHSWPPEEPLSLAQNWRSLETAPNSWGIPSLVLAVRGAGGGETRILRGGILDRYGRSGGRDRANGVAGYGAPLGEEFLYGDGVAQWFERGLIRADAAGGTFFEAGELPPLPRNTAGGYPGDDGTVGEQFERAWLRGMYSNLPALIADAPVRRLDTGATGDLPAGTLYLQTFNRGSVLLLLPDFPGIPFQARIIAGPFLDALLSEGPEADLALRLRRGLSRYGLPLTDACPEPAGDAWSETQRFTRGWMTRANAGGGN